MADVTGFVDSAGLKFDPVTGEAFKGLVNYVDGEPVTTWSETGFTFLLNVFMDVFGVHEKAGVIAYATKETAEKVKEFVLAKVDPNAKVEIKPAANPGSQTSVGPEAAGLTQVAAGPSGVQPGRDAYCTWRRQAAACHTVSPCEARGFTQPRVRRFRLFGRCR